MSETQFVDGLIIKAPHANAPDFVKCKISIKRDELIGWLQAKDEWVNLDVKVGKSGKWYASVDNWKKEEAEREAVEGKDDSPEEIPF